MCSSTPALYEDSPGYTISARSPASVTVQGELLKWRAATDDGRRVVALSCATTARHRGVWFNQAGAARGIRYGQRLAFSGKPKWHATTGR
jgi:hypothetical protein